LKKAQKLGIEADKLRKDILFEENNAIASRVREMGLSPDDFDSFIMEYMKQNPKTTGNSATAESVAEAKEQEDSDNETEE
jgi:hypothetical protein